MNGCAIARIVVNAAPTSTMNMTGLCHISRGSSFRNAPGSPVHSWRALKAPFGVFEGVCADSGAVTVVMISGALPLADLAQRTGNK